MAALTRIIEQERRTHQIARRGYRVHDWLERPQEHGIESHEPTARERRARFVRTQRTRDLTDSNGRKQKERGLPHTCPTVASPACNQPGEPQVRISREIGGCRLPKGRSDQGQFPFFPPTSREMEMIDWPITYYLHWK